MKYAVSLSVAVLFIFSSNFTQAQTGTSSQTVATTTEATTTPEVVDPEVTEAIPVTPEVIELSPRAQERIRNLAANLSNRIDATILRLQNIAERLESRSGKIAATGANTSSADIAISTASNALDQASGLMATIDEQIARVIGSDSPAGQWVNAKNTYQNATSLIRTAHSNLGTSILLLKNPPTTLPTDEPAESTDEQVTNN